MVDTMINVLLTSFSGLGLPSTLCLPLPSTATVADFTKVLAQRLPPRLHDARLIITTNSNKELQPLSSERLSALVLGCSQNDTTNFVPLRLSHALCGGKGGFGSQLRAAGGRMSSRKKRNQGDNNGSNRNLDGRRLRTVNEAKALAEYLAVKPDMDRKEKEERRKRWEQVVESAERREEDIRNSSKAKVDGKWAEAKEDAENKTREAVVAQMRLGWAKVKKHENDLTKETSSESTGTDHGNENEEPADSSSKNSTPPSTASEILATESRKIYGWDDDDLSDSE